MKLTTITDKQITLQIEEVKCWQCENGIATRNKLCPRWSRTVKGLTGKNGKKSHCPHCDASNRHSHKTVGEYTVNCENCKGVGTLAENVYYENLTKEIFLNFNFYFGGAPSRDASLMGQVFGMGTVHSETGGTFVANILQRNWRDKVVDMVKSGAKVNKDSQGVEKEMYDFISEYFSRSGFVQTCQYMSKEDKNKDYKAGDTFSINRDMRIVLAGGSVMIFPLPADKVVV